MPGLLLSRVSPTRSASVGADDYDVVGPDGWVIGRIIRRGPPPSTEESAWIDLDDGFRFRREPPPNVRSGAYAGSGLRCVCEELGGGES